MLVGRKDGKGVGARKLGLNEGKAGKTSEKKEERSKHEWHKVRKLSRGNMDAKIKRKSQRSVKKIHPSIFLNRLSTL